MIRRARSAVRLLLASALLYGSGAHWLVVQGGAWAAMVAARAGRESVAAALTTTFDGRHPCRVCLIVRHSADPDATPRALRSAPTADFAFAVPVRETAVAASVPFAPGSPAFYAPPPAAAPTPPPDRFLAA